MKKPTLTCRQKQVLRLVTFPNRRIARILGISPKTVACHLNATYKRLNLDHVSRAKGCRRIAAVTEALRRGFVTLEEIAEGDRPVKEAKETR